MEVEFGFDEDRFSSYLQDEVAKFKSNLKENISTIRSEFLISLALKYAQNPNEDYSINKGVILTPVLIKEGGAGFSIIYTSLNAWRYYNPSTAQNEEGGVYLVKKIASEGDFVFSSHRANGESVGERYMNAYLSSLKELSFEGEEKEAYSPCFMYDYATQSARLYSNGQTVYSAGLYHHVWIKNWDELANAKIKLWQYDVNYGLWQLLALALTILPCLIYVAFILIKERRMGIITCKRGD